MASRGPLQAVAVYLAQVLLLAAVYLSVAQFGLSWAIPPGYATAVWPPSGLALAAVLLMGRHVWPGIWLGHFLTNSLVAAHGGLPAAVRAIPTNAGIGLAGTGEALAGAYLLRRWANGRHALDS